MHMSFWFDFKITDFLFYGLNTNSVSELLFLCAVLFGLTVLSEWLKVLLMETKLKSSLLSSNQRPNIQNGHDGTMLLGDVSEYIKNKKSLYYLVEISLFVGQKVLSFLLMLSVMTYNGYVTIAILLGFFIGYVFFGQVLVENQIKSTQLEMPCRHCQHDQDASQNAYASVAFLRVVLEDDVRVQLIAAKSRVAPLIKISRGCSAKKLLEPQWWEGPSWLKDPSKEWPQQETQYNEDDINSEKRKTVISALSNVVQDKLLNIGRSTYKKTVRTIGWIYRFINNTLKRNKKLYCDLTLEEYNLAENKLFSQIQSEAFSGVTDKKLKTLLPFEDNQGLFRLKTKVSHKDETTDFCYPIVLPNSKNPIVFKLIMDIHKENCHVGSQMILTLLRERFWIPSGRRSIKSVLKTCVICKRYTAKHVESLPTSLPLDRVRNAKVFGVTGVDLAGPLFLKFEKKTYKAWICIFSCRKYRAVHLELVSSLSTDSFLMSLRRFISRRGLPNTLYADNGTNLTGANNFLRNLDWDSIERYSTVKKIQWKHSPPTGPWWGWWWERLIGILKKLLRRVSGNSCVTREEMETILCDCEAIINRRPLTYVSENPTDLIPLTPSLFLQDIEEAGTPDLDLVEASDLNQRLRYRQNLKRILTERFCTEYLGQLQLHANKSKPYKLSIGEVVLIGGDGVKRLNWPLARIVELIKGKASTEVTVIEDDPSSAGCSSHTPVEITH